MLTDADFPEHFSKKAHRDDYKPTPYPLTPELIYHKKFLHNRIFLRIDIQINDITFIPATFMLDTGAPMYIYANKLLTRLISSRITQDESENDVIILGTGKRMTINQSSDLNSDINILGLRALSYFGLRLQDNEVHLDTLVSYI